QREEDRPVTRSRDLRRHLSRVESSEMASGEDVADTYPGNRNCKWCSCLYIHRGETYSSGDILAHR
ncbi:MAG: hypothetical protein QGI09_11590, partial [Dehalococcoidia bacterium]|nr:hypothetical protein [Dehalococcoidia bacterium]